MERLKSLRTVVVIIAVLLVLQLVLLALMLRPAGFHVWASLGILALLCVFLVRLSFSLLNELIDKENYKHK